MSMGKKGKQLASRVTAFVETPLTLSQMVAWPTIVIARAVQSREALSTLLVSSQQWLTAPFLFAQSSHLDEQSSIMSNTNHFKRCPFEDRESTTQPNPCSGG